MQEAHRTDVLHRRPTFSELHRRPLPLIVPTAWDVGSALTLVEAGFPVIGTTSFGTAAAAGGPLQPRIRSRLTERLITHLAQLPVHLTADIENGYFDDPKQVADYAAALPVAGIDLADRSPHLPPAQVASQVAKITAIKNARPDLFVNARIGTQPTNHSTAIGSVFARASACVDAGADGVFVPAVYDPAEIRALTRRLPVPVTIHVDTRLSLQDMADLGVRRVNTGSLPYRAAMDSVLSVATSLRDGSRLPRATGETDLERRLRHARSLMSDTNRRA